MDSQIERLANRAEQLLHKMRNDQRLLIAIAGIPGSGKTTLAEILAKRLNFNHAQHSSEITSPHYKKIAITLPMDGFHLTRAQLSAMPDPEMAHARRGAEFTFDGKGFYELVKELRRPITSESTATVWAPSFDHAVKDPVEMGIEVPREARVIIFEGNYLLLDQKPWSDAAKMMDLKFFVRVPFDVATERLVKRHLAAGLAATEEEAMKRVVENDLVNGKMIEDLLKEEEVDEFVDSGESKSEGVHT
ncbi:unnamed protein product [Sordaria macrospora k-hell]|uniref:WGS project CABT00000000 data, contig 2.26 n=2 Tax=Sordaria macrospora TaxID=5147 RepID=F7W446_SORMK|nr:uncharacterized protein SMAC_05577 [Sordaria macrospora k-hell]CCC12400.1 unnamed protein product [Sordaria macrospora k-hell]